MSEDSKPETVRIMRIFDDDFYQPVYFVTSDFRFLYAVTKGNLPWVLEYCNFRP